MFQIQIISVCPYPLTAVLDPLVILWVLRPYRRVGHFVRDSDVCVIRVRAISNKVFTVSEPKNKLKPEHIHI